MAETPTGPFEASSRVPAALAAGRRRRPHVLLVMLDQVGFGATSPFGGPIRMRTAERLAAGGLRYTRFHTAGSGVTTRAALLTGRDAGRMCVRYPSPYGSGPAREMMVRAPDIGTLARILHLAGYATAQFGWCDEVPLWEAGPAGPFDRWPTNSGFDYFYGFVGATTHRYYPTLYEDTAAVRLDGGGGDGYHVTEDLADHAIAWVRRQLSLAAVQPLFLYLNPGAGRAPHQVPAAWADQYWGRFDAGWDALRHETGLRQEELGLWPADIEPAPPGVAASGARVGPGAVRWEDVPAELRPVLSRQMEVYAGVLEHADHEIGRVLDALDEFGALPDTMVWYLLGDSGASTDGGPRGTANLAFARNGLGHLETVDQLLATAADLGGPRCFNQYAAGWAQALCTPYRRDLSANAYWGTTRTGLIVAWPRGFGAPGELRHQFHHVVDVAPTVCAAANVPPPGEIDGVPQQPMDGARMDYTYTDAGAPDRRLVQDFDVDGVCARYRGGFVAVAARRAAKGRRDGWELFGPEDWTQQHDIAAQRPDLVRQMSVPAKRRLAGVERDVAPPVALGQHCWPPRRVGAARQRLFPGMGHMGPGTVLDTKNRSHSICAVVLVPPGSPAGVIVAHGAVGGGWALYLREGRLTYCYNLLGWWYFYVESHVPLPPGEHRVRAEFAYDGGGAGRGAVVSLFVDGHRVGRGRVEATHPLEYSPDESTGVGRGTMSPVTADYEHPGEFTGSVLSVCLDIDHLVTLGGWPTRTAPSGFPFPTGAPGRAGAEPGEHGHGHAAGRALRRVATGLSHARQRWVWPVAWRRS